jgi:intracellular sulfur oxidation DsrE/DsrF family protein
MGTSLNKRRQNKEKQPSRSNPRHRRKDLLAEGVRFVLCFAEQWELLHLIKGSDSREELLSAPPFPAVGHVYEANFESWVYHLRFESETVMTLTNIGGHFAGDSETVQITITPIRPAVFMVSWQEADKTTVVHVEDFKNGIVHTNVTGPNGIFLRRSGTWKRVH